MPPQMSMQGYAFEPDPRGHAVFSFDIPITFDTSDRLLRIERFLVKKYMDGMLSLWGGSESKIKTVKGILRCFEVISGF